jgi:hypothetical protein
VSPNVLVQDAPKYPTVHLQGLLPSQKVLRWTIGLEVVERILGQGQSYRPVWSQGTGVERDCNKGVFGQLIPPEVRQAIAGIMDLLKLTEKSTCCLNDMRPSEREGTAREQLLRRLP